MPTSAVRCLHGLCLEAFTSGPDGVVSNLPGIELSMWCWKTASVQLAHSLGEPRRTGVRGLSSCPLLPAASCSVAHGDRST